MFFDGFPPKTNHLLRATMPNCYEKNITISPKLATLASGQFCLMIHRQTHTHTHTHTQTQRQPTYMADFIFPSNKQTSKHANRQTSKQANRQTDKQTNRQTSKQPNKQTSKQANRQTDTNLEEHVLVCR